MNNLPITPKASVKSGTITLDQIKSNFDIDKEPVAEKQDNKKMAKEAFLKRKTQAKELRKFLHSTYPEVFDYQNPKPLAIGINKEIRALYPHFSHKTVVFFLYKWVKNPRYLKALLASEERFDLNNQATYAITEEQKKFAQTFLDKKTEKG